MLGEPLQRPAEMPAVMGAVSEGTRCDGNPTVTRPASAISSVQIVAFQFLIPDQRHTQAFQR